MRVAITVCLAAFAVVAFAGEDEDAALRRNAVVRAVESFGPAVVNISTEKVIEVPAWEAFPFPEDFFEGGFRPFFRRGTRKETQYSLGSGVIIDAERALVVTNEHVIRRADKITASLADGRSFRCRMLAVDAHRDLAILKLIDAKDLKAAALQEGNALYVGETVIAIGNAFGLENTVTTGVLSARHRTIEREGETPFKNLLQTDCAINPGNSGGPLLAITGKVIGINTAIKQGAEGIGFAIPAGEARALLGTTFPEEGDFPALGFGLAPDLSVRWVRSESAAEKAGLAIEDRITAVAGHSLAGEKPADLSHAFAAARGKETILLAIKRKKEDIQTTVDLSALAESEPLAFRGMTLVAVTPKNAAEFKLDVGSGVVVESVAAGSPAERIGVRPGDRLLSFGRIRVESLVDVRRVKAMAEERKSEVLMYLVRGEDRMTGRLPVK